MTGDSRKSIRRPTNYPFPGSSSQVQDLLNLDMQRHGLVYGRFEKDDFTPYINLELRFPGPRRAPEIPS